MTKITADQIAGAIRKLARRVDESEARMATLLSSMECGGVKPLIPDQLRAQAKKVIPFFYNMNITIPAAAARVQGQLTITQQGFFLLRRIYVSWRPTAGALAGRFRPVSSGIVAGAEAVAGAAIADKIDFNIEIGATGAGLMRQDPAPIPGDVLYRQDGDGCLFVPDIFQAAETISVWITPLVAPDHAGVAIVTLEGEQLLNVIES